MATAPVYSVVVPVYNGSQTLTPLIERLLPVLNKLQQPFEVIFVDDCSSDNSWEIITLIKQQHSFVKIYQLQTNCGQHTATLCGALKAAGNTIITIDDDLQIPPEEISKLIAKKAETGAQLVYGHFVNKRQSGYKNIGRRILFAMMKRMLEDFTYASSFRIFDRELLTDIDTLYRKYYTFDVSLILRKPKMAYVDVEHHTRQQGESGYKFRYLVGFVASFFINYTKIPIRIVFYLGLLLAVGGFAVSAITLTLKNPRPFYVSSIYLCTGLVLIGLALWAEQFARYIQANSARPLFIINQRAD